MTRVSSDIRRRLMEEEQRQKAEAQNKKNRLEDFKNSSKVKMFKQQHLPMFMSIISDCGNQLGYFTERKKPEGDTMAQIDFSYKRKDGFLSSIFPTKGYVSFRVRLGIFDNSYNAASNQEEPLLTALYIDDCDGDYDSDYQRGQNACVKQLDEVPENVREAKEWLNDVLYNYFRRFPSRHG